MSKHKKVNDALAILIALGLPRGQQNDRSALCLLALLNLAPDSLWAQAQNPMIGITPIINFCRDNYGKHYAPNTRETFRRQTMHQFVSAGIAHYNPDDPERPVNSPKAVYQLDSDVLSLIRSFGTRKWKANLESYQSAHTTLSKRYAKEHNQKIIPVTIASGKKIHLTPGEHSKLVKAIIEEFAPRFVPGARLVYVGDTGEKWAYCDKDLLSDLTISLDTHGKMPDVLIHYSEKNWLLLIESVTSHGPVDSKRHDELASLFTSSKASLVYVTAFPNRSIMARYLSEISWETEVWCSDSPSHLIHFNGERFLGPYKNE